MLTEDQIRAHLEGLEYRPGWTWKLERDPWEGLYVRIVGQVEDSYHEGFTIDIAVTSWLPPMETATQLDLWMQWRLWRIEGHESREFLRRDGKPLFDPHAVE